MLRKKFGGSAASHDVANAVSTIAAGMLVSGDLETSGDIRIDGKIEGNIFCKGRVVLGPQGVVDGDLNATNADIFGMVNGVVKIQDTLCLKNKCVINGNLFVGRLITEPEAAFNGQCTMNGDKKSVSAPVQEAKAILAKQN